MTRGPDHLRTAAGALYVGLARVLGSEADGRPRLLVFDRAATTTVADWALPFRYRPAPGDLLQVMGHRDRFWVTGVVTGRGRSQLAFRGDAALSATGTLRLCADAGVRVAGPEVRVATERLATDAGTVVQHAAEADTVVRGEFDERAGECARTIDGDDVHVAARHSTVAGHVVEIDGDLLRLS